MEKLTIRQDGDRSLQTRIPVSGGKSTHVFLSVSYSAGRGYTLSAVPATVTEDGFQCWLHEIEFKPMERAARYSAKRLQELGALMVREVEAGSGVAFDLLGKVLTKHGLERR